MTKVGKNEDRNKCLKALCVLTRPDGEMCVPFQPIQDATDLDRRTVRRHVRALARKGLAEYHRGLWCEFNDMPAGAGYCVTKAGQKATEAPND